VTSRIVLVGFMGAGKTTVGRELAALLGWDFVDLDERVEARAGRSVAGIFETDGEAAFRALELDAAREAMRGERVVIAAGGGAFAHEETRAALAAGATTVWLRCALPALLRRIPPGDSRPLARNRATIPALLSERERVYRLAALTVDTTEGAPRDAARAIARAVGHREAPSEGE
jgi:shikimate kinase/3-dehydroquinate synthase